DFMPFFMRQFSKYRLLESVTIDVSRANGFNPIKSRMRNISRSGKATKSSYLTIILFSIARKSEYNISWHLSQCRIRLNMLVLLHFLVAIETAIGCLSITTK